MTVIWRVQEMACHAMQAKGLGFMSLTYRFALFIYTGERLLITFF